MRYTSNFLVIFLILITLSRGSNVSHITDTIQDVVDQLWREVSENWFVTTGSNMATFFSRYEAYPMNSLSLYRHRFIGGAVNFTQEFGLTPEYAKAYFHSLDVVESWFFMRLTIEDMDTIVDRCDKNSGGSGMGFIPEDAFKIGFKKLIMRGLAVSLMFVRSDTDSWDRYNYFKSTISGTEFLAIYTTIDGSCSDKEDEKLTEEEFGCFWSKNNYGVATHGKTLFRRLNHENKFQLNKTDWMKLFHDLDCVSADRSTKDELLTHREMLQIDEILRGLRKYPLSGICRNNGGTITIPKQDHGKKNIFPGEKRVVFEKS